jgi:signal transduction histidine kinase/DNA-binding response OmpR family regulator
VRLLELFNWKKSIKSKLIVSNLIFYFITVILVGIFVFTVTKQVLINSVYARLDVAIHLKLESVDLWIENIKSDLELLSKLQILKTTVKSINAQQAPLDHESQITSFRNFLLSISEKKKDWQELFYLDSQGKILVSTDSSHEGDYRTLDGYFVEGLNNIHVQKIYPSPITFEPTITASIPILDKNNKVTGVLAMHVNLERMDEIIFSNTNISFKDESYLVDRYGSLITGEHTHTVEFLRGVKSTAIEKALTGESGNALYTNYKNSPVIGSFLWLDKIDAALIVEIPQDEAFASAKILAISIFVFGFISIIILGLIIYVIATKIAKPINVLSAVALDVTKGNLGARVDSYGDDEIGTLSKTFNHMTATLQHTLEELSKEKEKAERTTLEKTKFLATMSHEIRTPMNGVIGMAQLLTDTSLTHEQKDYVDTITRSGDGLLCIINDILDFSKLDVDMVEIENIPFDLERTCQESMELVVGNVKGKKLEFIFDYAPDCPRHFLGDPSRARQILINILGNAVKFTEQGFVRCGVSSELSDSGEEQLRLEIQDTGIGLRPNAIEGLFDEFTQADSATTRQYGGTGLGLAITKKLVDLMGGTIGVNSVEGEGSTFWITGILTPTESPEPTTPKSLKGVRILFVDDFAEYRKIFKRLLEHMGAKITITSDPTKVEGVLVEAEKSKTPFEIAILDHNMPQLSGLELGLQIRKNGSLADLKLLIFSSIGQKGDSALFASAGFNGYLNKLSRYETLRDILSTMLTHTTGNSIVTHHTVDDAKSSIANQSQCFSGLILIVEDNLTNQIIAKKFLVGMGLTVDIADNGQEAIEAYNSKRYDLIFMDCQMPVMDGYKATRSIRKIEQKNNLTQVPIIALTANASSDDRILCKAAAMDGIVTKPFKRTDLSKVLTKWLPI